MERAITMIPQPNFVDLSTKSSLMSIIDGYVKTTVFYEGEEYVITGAMGRGQGANGWSEIYGYRVVDLHKYTGNLQPLNYSDHVDAMTLGHRERSYNGLKSTYGKRTVVLVGQQITFKPSDKGKQIELF